MADSSPRKVAARRGYRPEAGVRDTSVLVKMTTAERDAIRRKADEARVSVGRLLVEGALGGVVSAPQRAEQIAVVERTNRLLANATANLNQLAHNANIFKQVTDRDRLYIELERVAELRAELAAAVKALR